MNEVPTHAQLLAPVFDALHQLGGSGSIEEIYEKVAESLSLSDETLSVPHNPEASNQTELQYRLAWSRTYLKLYGVIENSSRGVWAIASNKRHIRTVDAESVVKYVRELNKKRNRKKSTTNDRDPNDADAPEEARTWREELHYVLTQKLQPDAFERLAQRLLRESGFIHVEVTGKSGDGGIDGKGIARINGMLSFHVIFQCKRYQGNVTAGYVRDFRGAMVGRADRGLLITTGTFTRDAVREATRDGAPPIDLIDGDQLADKLKELDLGIETRVVEQVTVSEEWFLTL